MGKKRKNRWKKSNEVKWTNSMKKKPSLNKRFSNRLEMNSHTRNRTSPHETERTVVSVVLFDRFGLLHLPFRRWWCTYTFICVCVASRTASSAITRGETNGRRKVFILEKKKKSTHTKMKNSKPNAIKRKRETSMWCSNKWKWNECFDVLNTHTHDVCLY